MMRHHKAYLMLAILASVFMTIACKKSIYNQLTEDEMKWLIYKTGDRMIFSASGSIRDTFDVMSRDRGYVKDKPYYNESASTNFIKLNDTLGGNKLGMVRLSKDDDNNFSVKISFPHFHRQAELIGLTPLPVDTVNGFPYTNVYIVQADTLFTSVNDFIWKVYYSKESGFIKLEDIFGRTWYKTN